MKTINTLNTRKLNRSRLSSVDRKSPSSFRVLMKSRSGCIINEYDNKSQISCQDRKTSSQLQFHKQDIKSYVKSLKKEKATTTPNPIQPQNKPPFPPSIPHIETISTLPINHQQSQSPTKSLQQSKISIRRVNTSQRTGLRMPVEQLECKMDQLIRSKLECLHLLQGMQRYRDGNLTLDQRKIQCMGKVQDIDAEIQMYVRQIKQMQQDGDNSQLQDIDKRINIIEKVMAESMTQCQMAKKSYYKYLNSQKPRASRHINPYNHNIQKLKQKSHTLNKSLSIAINLQSTNQQQYKIPDKKSYLVPAKPVPYVFSNQPLHRSTYSRDFLKYGARQNYSFKQQSSPIIQSYSPSRLISHYTNQFTAKPAQRINFKELDCYRNKFRNINIPLITGKPHPKSHSKPHNTISHSHSQSQSPLPIPIPPSHSTICHPNDRPCSEIMSPAHKPEQMHYKTENYIKNISSESRNKFRGEENKIKSGIKHQNLYKLKYLYKATSHA